MKIRDRIKELRRVKASSLVANPRNWRLHPKGQQYALRGILDEIGYADALLVRELPDGQLEIIDGHLRAETTPDQEVPVLVLDLDQDEAYKLLAVLDPLGGMAEANKDALGQLLAEIQTDNSDIQIMLDELALDCQQADFMEKGENDPNEEWQDMPEFENPPKAFSSVMLHFCNEADMNSFSDLINQRITIKTKSLWFPMKQ